MRPREGIALLAVYIGLMNLQACGTSDDAPLIAGGDQSLTCLDERGARMFTFGVDALRNSGDQPLKLSGIELIDAEGFTLTGAELVPATGNLVGAWSQYPPPHEVTIQEGLLWTSRREAIGASIAPTIGHSQVQNLVVQLSRKDHTARAQLAGLLLKYEAGGNGFEERTTAGLGVGC